MLLLATDTSGKNGSIGLARCEDDRCTIIEVVPLAGGTFSAQLVPQIAGLLGKHEFSKRDIGALAVASGPGSFTGLRVGLAAIKALAEVLGKSIAAVSLLEAVAASAQSRTTVLVTLDAGRSELYLGEYVFENSVPQMRREWLGSREACFAAAAKTTLITPDRSIAEAARSRGLQVEEVEHPRSDAIARIGWRKIQSGMTVSPQDLEANYIRRSDAEIFSRSIP
jgi:tRNA threonylcarbamoyladenosine biosynthesis protein TsaB